MTPFPDTRRLIPVFALAMFLAAGWWLLPGCTQQKTETGPKTAAHGSSPVGAKTSSGTKGTSSASGTRTVSTQKSGAREPDRFLAARNATANPNEASHTGGKNASGNAPRQSGGGRNGTASGEALAAVPAPKPLTGDLAALKKLGARFDTDADENVIEISFRNKKLTPQVWSVFLRFGTLEILDLDATGLRDGDLAEVKRFRNLRVLSLQQNPITNDGLKHLSGLRGLENLALTKTGITGSGLKHIAGLTNLRTLNLSHCKIGDDALLHLTKMKDMETLALQNAGVTGPGLKYVGQLKNMITLTLSDSTIKGDSMLHLKGLSKLRIIHMYDCKVSKNSLNKLEAAIPTLAIFR